MLHKDKLYIEPVICEVNNELCRTCGTCVDICEFHAPELIVENNGKKKVTINKALCKGCGSCSAACLNGAIGHLGFTDSQILAMIKALGD